MSCSGCGKSSFESYSCTNIFCPGDAYKREREWAQPVLIPPSPIKTSNQNSSNVDDEAAAAVGALALLGGAAAGAVIIAAIAAAAAAAVYIPYKTAELVLDKVKGKRSSNEFYAILITAGFYGLLGSAAYLYNQRQEYLAKKYPALSVYVDGKRNFFAKTGHTEKIAKENANKDCGPWLFRTCQHVRTIPRGKPGCISV